MNNEDLREIYGLLRDIKAELAAMKATMTSDHERIDRLENKVGAVKTIIDQAVGARAILCAVAAAIGSVMVVVIEYFLGVFK